MSRYNLTSTYTAITETKGTLQNMSPRVPVVITTDETEDGIIVYPLNSIGFTTQIYAKTENGENVEVAVVPFVASGGGGGISSVVAKLYVEIDGTDYPVLTAE